MNKKKVGVFGGTFDPIHMGHLILAQNALEILGLDKVLIMPSGCSYLKDTEKVSKKEHRIEMTRLAIEDNDGFELSVMEAEREGNSYTYETFEILCSQNPDIDYYYIIGADVFMSMRTWQKPEEIFKRCTIACARRDNIPEADLKDMEMQLIRDFDAKVVFMDVPEVVISSSDIRDLINRGMSCRYYLNENVIEYIRKNGLYR
ncbi:MAG: nicotinate-nucleotide adenylyltransferase [Lachnospiraceae bacterium]|nr:nicotinate-nucleotide adenylyltransferase [Lachnospiraceae bacterium]